MSGIDVDGAVAVVTGASSGIGRATALALAERGASVVLAARSEADLAEVADTCRSAGADAVVVPTDVSREENVQALARRALDHFGRIDAWVNDAAVMAYGDFWDIPAATYRQVIETNLFGAIYGARAALEHFRDRGSGVLVNVASVYARVATPYVSPYVVSKFALRGLSQCLRQETTRIPGVDVCTVLPQAVDTPIFRHAGNYTGRQVTALPLVADPDRVVRAIIHCLERPRAEVVVGRGGHALSVLRASLPRLYEWVAPRAMDRFGLRPGPALPSDGNVFATQPELNRVDGGWRAERRATRRMAAATLAAGAAISGVIAGWRHRTTG